MHRLVSVLFDLDNVLVNASDWHYHALNRALLGNGIPAINWQDHMETYNGLTTKTKLEMMGITSAVTKTMIMTQKQLYTQEYFDAIKPDQTKLDLLYYLWKPLHGVSIGVVSNAVKQTVATAIDRLALSQYIDVQISNEDVKFPKPNSEGYIKAMIKFNSPPSNTLIVEDSPHGLTAARNTGATVWQVKDATEVTLKNFMKAIKETDLIL